MLTSIYQLIVVAPLWPDNNTPRCSPERPSVVVHHVKHCISQSSSSAHMFASWLSGCRFTFTRRCKSTINKSRWHLGPHVVAHSHMYTLRTFRPFVDLGPLTEWRKGPPLTSPMTEGPLKQLVHACPLVDRPAGQMVHALFGSR